MAAALPVVFNRVSAGSEGCLRRSSSLRISTTPGLQLVVAFASSRRYEFCPVVSGLPVDSGRLRRASAECRAQPPLAAAAGTPDRHAAAHHYFRQRRFPPGRRIIARPPGDTATPPAFSRQLFVIFFHQGALDAITTVPPERPPDTPVIAPPRPRIFFLLPIFYSLVITSAWHTPRHASL